MLKESIRNISPELFNRLCYITNARIPTEKAHGLQIIKMCEAFQYQGMQVELIVPFRMQSPAMKRVRNIREYYQIETPFRIRHLLAPDFVRLTPILPNKLMMPLYYAQCLMFSLLAVLLTVFSKDCVYYSRDLQTILVLCLTQWLHRKPIVFEAHELHGNPEGHTARSRLMRWMLRRIDGLVVITRQLETLYLNMGVSERTVLVASDGIDRQRLTCEYNRAVARKKLDIPLDKKIACYTGHLFTWKGVCTFAESAAYLDDNTVCYIVGGMDPDIQALRQFIAERRLTNITIVGYVPYCKVHDYLAAADVVVLPNSAKAAISREYTSPLKLFEYMAAQRPIVASDLPSLREILRHAENAYLVPPDDPQALAAGIAAVMKNSDLSERIAQAAYHDVQAFTWDARAEQIIRFIADVSANPA